MRASSASPTAAAKAPTRQQLTEAAAGVFATRGFRATTVRDICQRAGVNVAAINYHFGDKAGLYAEVLRHALRHARAKYPPDLGLPPGATVAQRLRAFVRSFLLRIFDAGPHAWHGQLLLREMVEPTAALDALVEEEIRPLAAQLLGIVRALLGGRAGDDLVRRCAMSVVSQILFYQHCKPVIVRLFPKLKFGLAEVEALADHITEFSLAAIRQLAKASRPRRR